MDRNLDRLRLFQRVGLDDVKKTSNFSVGDGCVGCGLCARLCPANAIEMRGGAPEWVKPRCFACLGCVRGCPAYAISYGMANQSPPERPDKIRR